MRRPALCGKRGRYRSRLYTPLLALRMPGRTARNHVRNPATVQAALNEPQQSIRIEAEGFENLIAGSSVTMEEVLKRAPSNWYIEGAEAGRLGLLQGVN